MTPHELVNEHTIYACVVGSRAYRLSGPDSDTDRRGMFVAPTESFWGLNKPPAHVDGPAPEQFSWELERCCELALQANPTVLECLWSPLVERINDAGRELLDLRGAFLSQRLIQSYGGYAQDQLKRLEASRRKSGNVKWKQAMHMVRLLLAGAHVLGTHQILVEVSAHRDLLLAIRRGEMPWEEVRILASTLEEALRAEAERTTLPVEPDRAAVNDFLIRMRRVHL